jgi:aminopeptidase YwaD
MDGNMKTATVFLLASSLVAQSPKTSLLPDSQLNAITREASGSLAKDTIVALGRFHRVHASPGFHEAAEFMAAKAREYGLEDVHIESFPADGKTTYNTFRSYLGWEPISGVLNEVAPSAAVIADYSKMRTALADYSNTSNVTADLIDVGPGTLARDYEGKAVKGKIVLAGSDLATVHRQAVELRGAAGVLSYQPNQVTGWSGDYPDLVRWGHLSPYNEKNTFAFMISLRRAREFQSRLARGENIRLQAMVDARMKPSNFEVVTGVIRGSDPDAGEIVFSCHLCHQKPGANDDASGAAAILEDARLLVKLITEGKLPRPRRTIRFMWPPEIAGTMCYLARHADEIPKMRAAIHMDMVGGDPKITKAILHLTRTPASLPSFVNDVAAVFGEYVMDGARRAAMAGDFSDANISPEGSKDMLLADFHDFTMGSDHDVYEEGSFRVPTIYMNDWPDVFIHTNQDTPDNMDATKLQRVAVIGAASGYFLASAGPAEGKKLAGEVFARGGERQGRALAMALAANLLPDAYNYVEQAGRSEQAALASVAQLIPEAKPVVDGLMAKSNLRLEESRAVIGELRGKQVRAGDTLNRIIPARNPKVIGNLDVYYYDYLKDHLDTVPPVKLDGTLTYEALNLVDGRRSVTEIHNTLRSAYGELALQDLLDYFKLLEKAGVVSIRGLP